MANANRPNGFRPVKAILGGSNTTRIAHFQAEDRSADTTNDHGDIYVGDPVSLGAGGGVLVANSGDVVLGVAVATGVDAVEFGEAGYYNPDDLESRFLAFDQNGVVGVVLANGWMFEAQTNAILTLAVGALADFNIAAATQHGNRATGNSTAEVVVAANNDVQVMEQDTRVDNDITLANSRYLFKFNSTTFAI